MNDYADIEPRITKEELLRCVRLGVVVNDIDDDGRDIRVSRGSVRVDGSRYDESDVDAVLSAEDLMDALTILAQAPDGEPAPHPTGLVLRKTVIEGALDLAWLDLDLPLRFDGCVFVGGITFDYATLAALTIDSCEFDRSGAHLPPSVTAASATVRHDLSLRGVKGLGQLFLVDCSVGELNFGNEVLHDLRTVGYRFRTVLDGTTVNRLLLGEPLVSAAGAPLAPPLGAPSSLSVGSVALVSAALDDEPVTVTSADPRQIAAWIKAGGTGDATKTPYTRQVWEAFAEALDRDAMSREATELRILGGQFGREKKTGAAKLWDWIVEKSTGYGLKNGRALIGWLGVLVVTVTVTAIGTAADAMGDYNSEFDDPLRVLLYSLNVVLSPVGTDGPQDWFFSGADTWLALTLSVLKVASIGLIGLFVTGVTGILSKK